MKVHLEKATAAHVQTFAWGSVEPEEHGVARQLGFADAAGMFDGLLSRSQQAYAMVGERDQVIAMAGVLRAAPPGRMWLHMPPVFKTAGFGALRVARLLIERWLGELGELLIDVEASNTDVVRMADWLGFKRCAPDVEKLGRTFHQCRLRRAA